MITLDTEKIDNENIRENFEKISEVINSNPIVGGELKVFNIEVFDTSSTILIRHGFKFTPTDVWVSWISQPSTVSIKYEFIDNEFLAFTSSQECKLRIIAGRIS